MGFERWLIEGTLTTLSPLHIGDGECTHRMREPRLRNWGKDLAREPNRQHLSEWERKAPVDINSVAVAAGGMPYIPATALKGALRAWLEGCGLAEHGPAQPDALEQVFGRREHGGLGGKAEFADALWSSENVTDQSNYWCPERSTSVMAGVAIDRDYRTAADGKLHHHEYVPAGVTFRLTIAAKALTADELAILLRGLQALDGETDGVTLGASNGDGWGRVRFDCTAIRNMDAAGVLGWLKDGAPDVLNARLPELGRTKREELLRSALALRPMRAKAELSMKITLRFRDFFLVNDVQRSNFKREETELPNFAPREAPGGGSLLPAASFRGRMRAQMERIVRTIGGQQAAHDPSRHEKEMAIHGVGEFNRLDHVSLLFGAPGWRAPLSVTDFTAGDGGEPGTELDQEFVAIDRFLGSGADHLKFNGKSFYKPVITGRITIDLERLAAATGQAGKGVFALLAFLLRDLKEGDLTFGYGTSKGYGACEATIGAIEMTGWERVRAELGFRDGERPPVEALSFAPDVWNDDTKLTFSEYAGTLAEEMRALAPAER